MLCVLSRLSRVRLFETPWAIAHQAPPSMGFSRQEYWSGLSCPPPWDLPQPETEPASLMSPTLAGRFFTTSATGKDSSGYHSHHIPFEAYTLGSARRCHPHALLLHPWTNLMNLLNASFPPVTWPVVPREWFLGILAYQPVEFPLRPDGTYCLQLGFSFGFLKCFVLVVLEPCPKPHPAHFILFSRGLESILCIHPLCSTSVFGSGLVPPR